MPVACLSRASQRARRCIQTAHAISVATGARICIEPGLSEGPGHVRGWLPDMLERKRYFPEIDLSYRPLAPEPEGETCDRDVIPRGVRMSRALSGLEPTRGQLVVVTHASVMLSLVAAAAAGVGHVGGSLVLAHPTSLLPYSCRTCARAAVCAQQRGRLRWPQHGTLVCVPQCVLHLCLCVCGPQCVLHLCLCLPETWPQHGSMELERTQTESGRVQAGWRGR